MIYVAGNIGEVQFGGFHMLQLTHQHCFKILMYQNYHVSKLIKTIIEISHVLETVNIYN